MGRKKYKTTGFARFFLFMLIAAPLAYIGASYYNGEDGIQNIKDLVGLSANDNQNTTSQDSGNQSYDMGKMIKQNEMLERQNKNLIEQNRELNNEIDDLKEELQNLKNQ